MKSFKPLLALLLVFLAGAVFGVVGTRLVVRRVILRLAAHPDALRERVERDLVRKLDLTPDQRVKVHQTLMDSQTQIRDLRREFAPRYALILSNAHQQIATDLTPDQRRRLEQFRQENRRLFNPGR